MSSSSQMVSIIILSTHVIVTAHNFIC